MSGAMFLEYPLHKRKSSKHTNSTSASARKHGLIVLLIVLAALLGSSTISPRSTAVAVDDEAKSGQGGPHMAAVSSVLKSLDAKLSSAQEGNLTRPHLLKDAAIVAVCLLAASLWWFVRAPSGNERRPSRGSSQALLVPASPWNADEQERKQISRDLHDCVGQVLTAAGMELASARSSALSQEQLAERLESVSHLNAEALRLVKDLAIGLRPAMLDDIGLADALRWQVRQFARRTGVLSSIEIWGEIDPLPEAQRTCIYRCVQEALTNCAKHSKAGKVEVLISVANKLVTFAIEDDGIGLRRDSGTSPGLGILGMHERVESLGGQLKIESQLNQGTRLMFEVPMPVEAHA